MKREPTDAQLIALGHWQAYHGKGWRKALWQAWQDGKYPSGSGDASELQTLRNTLGPGWLARYRGGRNA